MGSLNPASSFGWSVDGRIRIKMSFCHFDAGCHGATVSAGAVGPIQSNVPMREVGKVEGYKGVFPPKFWSVIHAAPGSLGCWVEEMKIQDNPATTE